MCDEDVHGKRADADLMRDGPDVDLLSPRPLPPLTKDDLALLMDYISGCIELADRERVPDSGGGNPPSNADGC